MKVEEDVAALPVSEKDVSPFKGLIPRPLERWKWPLLFLPRHGTARQVNYGSNIMSVTEVLDMVKLVNEAFQCLGTFNLDL